MLFVALLLLFLAPVYGQRAQLRPASQHTLPMQIDGNSPAFWTDGQLQLFNSTGNPQSISTAPDQFGPWHHQLVDVTLQRNIPVWVEAAWRDTDGTVFAWYHHEPEGLCGSGSSLTAPRIGAAISRDGGRTLEDLGVILESGEPLNCGAQNGFFAGGHGDFSVIVDREHRYFYFLFTNYGGPAWEQGVVVARMAFEDRFAPVGAVKKFYLDGWTEPGLRGHMTPIFPSFRTWDRSNADSFWGPSVHWNTHLNQYVVLLNRACCEPRWPQEGIYVTFNPDLSKPWEWQWPVRLIDGKSISHKPGFYPQVLGLGPGETDTLAGEAARLYIHGVSDWEIVFSR